MRRSCLSPRLQLIAAAAASDSASAITSITAMSSGRQFRGGRSYSDRPKTGGRGHFVSGDTHIQSVRDANNEFRRGARGGSPNRGGFQSRPFNQRSPIYRNPEFGPPAEYFQPPPFKQNPRFRGPPRFDQTLGFEPPQQARPRRGRPLDYRDWEYAKISPPPNCEKFRVLSYNILADYLASEHYSKLYFHIPGHMMSWRWRKKNLIFELGLWSADIMCFQEVDRFHDLEEELKLRGYHGVWKMRTGKAIDGCAIFWRTSRFKLLHEEFIEFNKLGLRDNVAQICVLELTCQSHAENTGNLPTSPHGGNQVVICNIHILYNPKRGDIKIGQVRALLDRAYAVSKLWDSAPVIVCGDFNCTPKSPLYNFITEQKLDISGVDRDKISGQASTEVLPYRLENQKTRLEGAVQDPTVDVTEKNIKLNDSAADMKEEIDADSHLGSVFSVENMSQALHVKTSLYVPDSSLTSGQDKNEDSLLHSRTLEDSMLGGTISSACVTGDSFEGRSEYCDSKGGFPPHLMNEKETPSIASSPGNAFSHVKVECGSLSHHNSTAPSSQADTRRDLKSSESFNLKINSLEPASQISSTNDADISSVGEAGNLTSQAISNAEKTSSFSCASTSTNVEIDKRLEESSLNCLHEAGIYGNKIDENEGTFVSTPDPEYEEGIDGKNIDQSEDIFVSTPDDPEDLFSDFCQAESSKEFISLQFHSANEEALDDWSPSLDAETVEVKSMPYNPALWTPMEVMTATGNADLKVAEHPLKLTSTYTEIEDASGTRDSSGEPTVTSYNRCFQGTVDYIWRSEGLQTAGGLAPIPKHAMQWTKGFPTKKWASDHIALVSELAFTKNIGEQKTEGQ